MTSNDKPWPAPTFAPQFQDLGLQHEGQHEEPEPEPSPAAPRPELVLIEEDIELLAWGIVRIADAVYLATPEATDTIEICRRDLDAMHHFAALISSIKRSAT